MSNVYDVSTLPTGGLWPFAWWCRGCGVYRPVDDHDHCRHCVPPLAVALRCLLQDHLRAARAGVEGAERRYHLGTVVDVLALLGSTPRVLDEDDPGTAVIAGGAARG
ncbi:MAG: hypothetical protein ACREQ5_36685 [Candidatus Dormibacteria bacterium]